MKVQAINNTGTSKIAFCGDKNYKRIRLIPDSTKLDGEGTSMLEISNDNPQALKSDSSFAKRLTEEITAEVNSRKPQPRMGRKAQRRLFTKISQIINRKTTPFAFDSDAVKKVVEKLTATKLCGK